MSGMVAIENVASEPGRTRNRARRAARICFPFSGDALGGSHFSALGLIRRLDRDLYDPLVVVPREDGKIAALFRSHEVPVAAPFGWTELPFNQQIGINALGAALSRLGPQIRFLRDQEISIVHSNDGRTHVAWALAAKLAGTRLLWHHRGHPDARGLRFAAPLLADCVLTVSRFSLPKPGRFSAAKKAQVVHSPFDTAISVNREEARAALVEDLGLSPDTLLVAYSGSLVERKRPHLFIEAIARMRDMAPERPIAGVMFGVAENADMDVSLRRLIVALGLEERIRMMGWRENGAYWLAASDMLLVPAIDEPFGRTLVEAMLVGTPIIATRSGGNAEALREGELGRLVPAEDATELARAALALGPLEAREIATRAQADARTRFGMDLHCRQVTQVYEDLLQR